MPGNRPPRWWPAVRVGLLGAAAGAIAGPVVADLIDRGNQAWLRRDAELAEYVYGREAARQTRRRGPGHPRTLQARANYGAALYRQGRLEEADAQFADVIIRRGPAVGEDDALLLAARAWRARVLYDLGSYDDAERQWDMLARTRARLLGPRHRDTLSVLENHAIALYQLGRFAEAEAELAALLAARQAGPGPDDPDTRRARDWHAVARRELGSG